jgi:hypothetical protein
LTSNGRVAANTRNASLSTGPRTVGGKLRSRNNAFRHGLAVRIGDDPTYAREIERLAAQLAGFSNEFFRNEHARTLAECHFDLRRVRSAATEVLSRIGELETATLSAHAAAAAAFEKINRYENRILSRRRKTLRKLDRLSEQKAVIPKIGRTNPR